MIIESLPDIEFSRCIAKIYVRSLSKLYIKDATVGTNYNEGCKQCENYPCQDALISMRITADGQLKKCLIRDDNLVPFLDDIRCGRIEEAERKISSSWGELIDTEYCPGKWRSKS